MKNNLTILSLLCFSIVSFGQTKVEKIDELIGLYSEYGQFNGSILVAENGKVIYKKGFGLANMEWNIPNEPNTKHRLGSVTKQFTSMLIMQLVEAGKLRLDVPITTYLPTYPKTNGDIITIHHLLTHTSGIPNYTSFRSFRTIQRDYYTPEDFIKTFADSTLGFKPGEKFSYSNSGYFLLGVIIEKVTRNKYEQVFQDSILTPLQMNNTGYDHHGAILKNRATGYEKDGNSYINAPFLDMSIPYAAGSLYSTVEDLYLWDQALYTDRLLSPKNMELIFTSYADGYGYGWAVSKKIIGNITDSVTEYGHQGGINGFHTIITRIVTDTNLIVLLNNTGGAPLSKIKNSIESIIYGNAYDFPQKSLANELLKHINKKGIVSGFELFNKLKTDNTYILIEGEMNRLGYQLLGDKKIKEAIVIFKLNVAEFPASANAYDSLGEVYLEDGNKELSLKNYKKAVALNAENPNAIKIIKELEAK
jgi:CubicO group peptidase (beta-lactamase class C family)